MAENKMIQVGPWGGNGGDPWEFITDRKITTIKIHSGNVVNAVRFTYKDASGSTHRSDTFGGEDGTPHEIHFAHDEELQKISGRFGEYGDLTVVTSLTFVTNRNTYGGYGKYAGDDFSLPITEGKIAGFHGRCCDLLDAVGVVLKP